LILTQTAYLVESRKKKTQFESEAQEERPEKPACLCVKLADGPN
jgi:hypothetical protein